ncbi:MAG: YfhO family protein [Bacteroidia bacterium]|nr:YfhO family protein [Bacteroidia bacterium]
MLQLFLAWMVVLGLKELLAPDLDKKRALRAFKYSAGIVGGLTLIFALIGSSFQRFQPAPEAVAGPQGQEVLVSRDDQFYENLKQQLQGNEEIARDIMQSIRDDRASMQSADAWRSFVFIALAAVLIWVFLIDKLAIGYCLGGLALLILVDLWAVDRRYLNAENFVKPSRLENFLEPTEADRQILADPDPHFRVLNATQNVFNDATTSYFHQSVGGYHAAKLRRYQDLIDAHLSKNNMAVYSMLNTKYFIVPGQTGPAVQANENAMGHAWLVKDYELVENADAEIKALTDFDPAQTAYIDQRFKDQLNNLNIKPDPKAEIKLTAYEPDHLVYKTKVASPQLAIFPDIYYVDPGKMEWKVFLDGKEVPHLRANYVLRGMVVPKGEHTLEFRFVAPVYQSTQYVDLVSSILLTLGLISAAVVSYRRKGKAVAPQTDDI